LFGSRFQHVGQTSSVHFKPARIAIMAHAGLRGDEWQANFLQKMSTKGGHSWGVNVPWPTVFA
jgi:hypothetical protein